MNMNETKTEMLAKYDLNKTDNIRNAEQKLNQARHRRVALIDLNSS